ncbi:MAG: glycosyltransferase family 4 protein [bacterium]|nr:glycosyltransferase family 4 protein [bacterium]
MIRVVEVLEATVGGTRKYLRALVEALAGDEFDVRVVCSTLRDPGYAEDIEHFEQLGARVLDLPMVRAPRPLADARSSVRLRRHLREEGCDVLHVHSAKAGWVGRIAGWGSDCQVVYTPHAFPFLQQGRWPTRPIYWFAERLVARRADVLLAVSRHEGAVAVESGLFPASRVRVLPNAVDPRAVAHEVADQPGADVPEGALLVGFLGDLREQKDPLTFVRAARRVLQRLPHVHFAVPCCGPLLADVERAIASSAEPRRFHVVRRHGSLLPYYRQMALGVQSSRWEGLPYTLLEALALGIPVVGSDIPPVADVLRSIDDDWVFPVGDDECLAERMLECLTLGVEQLGERTRRGRALVEERHAIEPWRSAMREFYRSLVR